MTAVITDDLAALRPFAEEVGTEGPVAVAGARTCWELGGELAPRTRVTAAPSGLVAYQPEEMTVRVRAGTSVAELHDALLAHRQRTALPERGGTVGGALAAGRNDLQVLGRGRVRDSVLQIRYISAEGRIVTGGGPTVKNVTGFDLPRLMVGALGTLGLLAEAVLRTRPIGEATGWYVAGDADPFEVRRLLHRPGCILWDGEQTWVQLEGHTADVRAETTALRMAGAFAPAEGPPVLPLHRWSLRPSDLRTLDPAATGPFVALIGVGTVHATLPQPTPRATDPPAVQLAARVKAAFDPAGRLNPGRVPGRR